MKLRRKERGTRRSEAGEGWWGGWRTGRERGMGGTGTRKRRGETDEGGGWKGLGGVGGG